MTENLPTRLVHRCYGRRGYHRRRWNSTDLELHDNFEDGEFCWITPADLSGYKDKYIAERCTQHNTKGA